LRHVEIQQLPTILIQVGPATNSGRQPGASHMDEPRA
jgi:hypothetical protein